MDPDFRERFEQLLQGGDPQHMGAIRPAADPALGRIAVALDLIAGPLEHGVNLKSEPLAPNVLAATACLISAFRGIRAAVLLALSGYPTEALAVGRRIYECAALARMLAHEAELAERWLKEGQWFPDGKVRQWFGVQSQPGDEPSGYQTFYKQVGAFAHPTIRSTARLLLRTDPNGCPVLTTSTDISESLSALDEIAKEALYVCFALRNACVSPAVLPPGWHQTVKSLMEQAGLDTDHLEQDWDAAQQQFDRMMSAVIPADQLDQHLTAHPNSWDNIQRRAGSE